MKSVESAINAFAGKNYGVHCIWDQCGQENYRKVYNNVFFRGNPIRMEIITELQTNEFYRRMFSLKL